MTIEAWQENERDNQIPMVYNSINRNEHHIIISKWIKFVSNQNEQVSYNKQMDNVRFQPKYVTPVDNEKQYFMEGCGLVRRYVVWSQKYRDALAFVDMVWHMSREEKERKENRNLTSTHDLWFSFCKLWFSKVQPEKFWLSHAYPTNWIHIV